MRHLKSAPSAAPPLAGVTRSVSPGTWWMVAAAASFALMAGAAKMLPHLPTMEKVFARSVVSVVLTGWALWRAGVSPWPRHPGLLTARAVLGFFALAAYFEGIRRIPLGTAVTIYNTAPLWAGLIGWLVLRERYTWGRVASVLVGLAGIALIQRFSPDVAPAGLGFVLTCSFLSASAYTLVRVLNRRGEHPMVIVLGFPAVSIPLALLFAYLPGFGGLVAPHGSDWAWLLVLGLGTQGGQVCLTHALRHLPASRATQIGFVGVVFAMLLGVFMGDGLPTWPQLVGAALVFASLALFHPKAAPTTLNPPPPPRR